MSQGCCIAPPSKIKPPFFQKSTVFGPLLVLGGCCSCWIGKQRNYWFGDFWSVPFILRSRFHQALPGPVRGGLPTFIIDSSFKLGYDDELMRPGWLMVLVVFCGKMGRFSCGFIIFYIDFLRVLCFIGFLLWSKVALMLLCKERWSVDECVDHWERVRRGRDLFRLSFGGFKYNQSL